MSTKIASTLRFGVPAWLMLLLTAAAGAAGAWNLWFVAVAVVLGFWVWFSLAMTMDGPDIRYPAVVNQRVSLLHVQVCSYQDRSGHHRTINLTRRLRAIIPADCSVRIELWGRQSCGIDWSMFDRGTVSVFCY